MMYFMLVMLSCVSRYDVFRVSGYLLQWISVIEVVLGPGEPQNIQLQFINQCCISMQGWLM